MPRKIIPQMEIIEPKEWATSEEIDRAIIKLNRRITDLEKLDIRSAFREHTGADDVVISDIRETIREVFGCNSPEFKEYEYIRLWTGPEYVDMNFEDEIAGRERGRKYIIGILNGLISRLEEKREYLVSKKVPSKKAFLEYLNLHPRIADVASVLFKNGHHAEAVFASTKALVNYVKERSNRHDLDGANLMRNVFSRKNPVLAFNELANPTDEDEQEGMMHLFEGVVLGIRNPGGHAFPELPEQRAVEYLSLISLLAYRVKEAKRRSTP